MPIGKILCLGDSHTAGDEQNAAGYRSYRGALQQLLLNAGYTVDFVGTQFSVPATGGDDGDHDGYGGARMDSSDSANNSIEGRITAIRNAVGYVDIIILYIGYNDLYANTANIDTKFGDLIATIQSGVWASTRVVMCTLHPEPGKTAVQMNSDYPAYAALNSKIRSMVG